MIDEIRAKIADGLFEFSKHAVDQSLLRRISVQELHEAIDAGEIIEDQGFPIKNSNLSML